MRDLQIRKSLQERLLLKEQHWLKTVWFLFIKKMLLINLNKLYYIVAVIQKAIIFFLYINRSALFGFWKQKNLIKNTYFICFSWMRK